MHTMHLLITPSTPLLDIEEEVVIHDQIFNASARVILMRRYDFGNNVNIIVYKCLTATSVPR